MEDHILTTYYDEADKQAADKDDMFAMRILREALRDLEYSLEWVRGERTRYTTEGYTSECRRLETRRDSCREAIKILTEYKESPLLSAAPDLLKALKSSVFQICNDCRECELDSFGLPVSGADTCREYKTRRAVLRRALGRQGG